MADLKKREESNLNDRKIRYNDFKMNSIDLSSCLKLRIRCTNRSSMQILKLQSKSERRWLKDSLNLKNREKERDKRRLLDVLSRSLEIVTYQILKLLSYRY
jgi:hypothetical protein